MGQLMKPKIDFAFKVRREVVVWLPKFPSELKENSSDLLLWAKFLNAEREEFEMLAKKYIYWQGI